MALGCGGGSQVVSVLTFSSDDPSSTSTISIVEKLLENKEKEAGNGTLHFCMVDNKFHWMSHSASANSAFCWKYVVYF